MADDSAVGADNPSYVLHWPGSANAAASVCLYSEQERSLTCRPIVRSRLTAGLWSPVRGGRSAIASPRRVPSLHFDMCITALETRPLPAISRAYPPVTSTNYPAAYNEGGRRFPGPPPGVDRPLRSPCSLLAVL